MPRSGKTNWKYIAIPDWLKEEIVKVVVADKYPKGKWHSVDHFFIEAVKAQIEREKGLKKPSSL